MKRKSLSNRRKTGKGRIAAVLALAVLLGAAPAIKTDAYPEGPYTVHLNIPTGDEYAELLSEDVGAVVDVYKVASAVGQEGTDAYTFEFEAPFTTADTKDYYINQIQGQFVPGSGEAVDPAAVNTFTQNVEAVALDNLNSKLPNSIPLGNDIELEDAGMYLLVPHGNMDNYTYVSDNPDSVYKATIAEGNSKRYIFAPILVSVPNRGFDISSVEPEFLIDDNTEWNKYAAGTDNTASREEWETEVDVTLKIAWKDLITKFQIDKNLVRYESMSHRTEPATFVFRIDAVDNKGNNVFSDVRSITLTEATTSDPITIDNVPVGATVTVSEDYPGADYKCTGATITGTTGNVDSNNVVTFKSIPAPAEEEGGALVLVSFKNDYTDTWKDSGSVANRFESSKKEDGSFIWNWDEELSYNSHETVEQETGN